MTRFWIILSQAVEFVMRSRTVNGGGRYIARMPSKKVAALARAIAPQADLVEIGCRPDEKFREEMMCTEDSRRTIRLGNHYEAMPTLVEWGFADPLGERLPDGFHYTSNANYLRLSVGDFRTMHSLMGN